MKSLAKGIARKMGLDVQRYRSVSSPIGFPSASSAYSIDHLTLNSTEKESIKNFRTDRYYWLNEYRWRLLLQAGIELEGKTIFEPGAGIGDQTYWLLQQGASKIVVSEGRPSNLSVIEKRYQNDSRVKTILGDIETCLDSTDFRYETDIVFMWGVYYHVFDPVPEFPILEKISKIAPTLVMDYQQSLTGSDYIENYDYENPSASISHASWRHTQQTMSSAIKRIYGHVYVPVEQMDWVDPSCANTPRRIIIGSKEALSWDGIVPIV
jgi:hypothetical protein